MGVVTIQKCPKILFHPLFTDKSTSLPSSSKELADIFGGSDEEEDMDFPFSLNVEKSFPPLSLPDGRVSEFFLNSINALGDPVNMESGLVASLQGEAGEAEKVATPDEEGKKEGRGDVGKEGEDEIKVAAGIEGANESNATSKEEGRGKEAEVAMATETKDEKREEKGTADVKSEESASEHGKEWL